MKNSPKIKSDQKNSDLLTQEQAYDVVQFANSLFGYDTFGVYTPWLSNQNLIDLNNNPRIPTYEGIVKALKDYKNQGCVLQAYSEFMEVFDMLYNRTIEYYVNLLSFDLQLTCKNTNIEYDSKKYLDDKNKVYKFLDNFDYKSEFKKVVKQLLRHETDYVNLRVNDNNRQNVKYALQMLPQDRCILTGYFESGLLFDFDMMYFMGRPGIDIENYSPIFKKYMNDLSEVYNDKYRPSNPLNERDGSFVLYHQTSPDDGFWCFKFDTSNFSSVPFMAPLLKNIFNNIDIAKLQKNKDAASAYGILFGEMRMQDSAKSGEVADRFAIKPQTLGKLMSLIASGLKNSVVNEPTIRAVAMPLENSKFEQYEDKNPDMAIDSSRDTIASGVSASRILYATDRMSNIELEAALTADYEIVSKLYTQFNNFMEFYVNRTTQTYKFKFTFDGCTQPFWRKRKQDAIMKLAEVGIVLNSSAFAAAYGYKPTDFDRMLHEAHNGDFLNNLSQLLSIHTVSSSNQGGRPSSEEPLTESGERSRNQTATS